MSVISCQSCGATVDDAWSVCPQCGSDPRLGVPEVPAPGEEPAFGPAPAPAYMPEPASVPEPAGAPDSSALRGLSTEPSPEASSSDLKERLGRQRRGKKQASGLGCLVFVIIAVASFAFEVWTDTESDKANDYERLSDRITQVQARMRTTPGKIDELLANDVLGPLIDRDGTEVTVTDPGMSGGAHLLPILREAQAVIAANNRDLATLAELWDEMARLETNEATVTYAGQQKQLAQIDRQMGDLTVEYFGTLGEACEQVPLSRGDERRLGRKASDLLERMAPLESRYEELARESDQYYNEHF